MEAILFWVLTGDRYWSYRATCLAGTATTKVHSSCGSDSRDLLAGSSGDWKSMIKLWPGRAVREAVSNASFPSLRIAIFSLSSHSVFSLCVCDLSHHLFCLSVHDHIYLFSGEYSTHTGLGPILIMCHCVLYLSNDLSAYHTLPCTMM